jgi:hypothetical protein
MILLVYVLVAAACTRLGARGCRREHVDLEVRRALERNCAESPNLARQLSVFDDRQLVTGLSGTTVRGASAYAELDGERRDTIYTGLVRRNIIGALFQCGVDNISRPAL